MKQNQRKLGAVLSYGQTAINILVGLLYTPVMISSLGQNEYGLYNTVSSAISALGILNLGFGAAYIRYYAKYKADKDEKGLGKLNGLFLAIFTVIGVIALACGLFLSFHLEYVFDAGLTGEEYATARILMLLLTVSLALSFPMSVFANIITANERYVVLKAVGLIRTVLGPMVTLPLLLLGHRSVAVVLVSVVLSFVADCVNVYYVLARLKSPFSFGRVDRQLFRGLFAFTAFIAINMVVDQINWNIDKLLLARFRGTAQVAIYSVGFTLYSYYQSFSTAVSGVFTPRIHRIVNETGEDLQRQRRELTELFVKVGRIQFLILGLLASGLVFFGKPFITALWAGAEYEEAYYVMMLLVLPASVALTQNLGIEIQRAQNCHQFRGIVYVLMAAVNLVMSVFLCRHLGAVGCAIGTAASLLLANGLTMNIYYHKRCNVDILCFWKNIGRLSLGLPLPVAAGVALNCFLDLRQPGWFVLAVAVYTALYCLSMWCFGMNGYEKDLVATPLRKLRRKRSHERV